MTMSDLQLEISQYPGILYDEITNWKDIGSGTFGTVYKAMFQHRCVAIKKFRVDVEKEKIAREIRYLCRVSIHPNVIDVCGISIHSSEIFLVMEFAECGSLQKVLHMARKSYSDGHALSWSRQCADAVTFLHAMKPSPLLHRDLKPANLLLTNKYRTLKVCDFGLVAELKTDMTENSASIAWTAPEMFRGKKYTEKCDVYSLAIILWELLTRKNPYNQFESAWAILVYVCAGNRPEIEKECPEEIVNLITSCWHQDSTYRLAMKDVAKALKDICQKTPGADVPLKISRQNELHDVETVDNGNTEGVISTSEEDDLTGITDITNLLKELEVQTPESILIDGAIVHEIVPLTKIGTTMQGFMSGAFGITYKGSWNNTVVAIKMYHQNKLNNDFDRKIKKLSRVVESQHRFICLFHASICEFGKVLIMEYADGGSLYEFLHDEPKLYYSAGHAMSWLYQCAEGIAFLHSLKPHPLPHRDLRSGNLFLRDGYRYLKIGDFATEQEMDYFIKINRSKDWMPPEVLGGSKSFSRKCNVFNWGVIMFEVIFRKQPERELVNYRCKRKGVTSLLRLHCPDENLINLMTNCWQEIDALRPSMKVVMEEIYKMGPLFLGADNPLPVHVTGEEPDVLQSIKYYHALSQSRHMYR